MWTSRQVLSLMLSLSAVVQLASAVEAAPPTPANDVASQQPGGQAPNWADQFLADDPLSARQQITLDDLRQGLADPTRRDRILPAHFSRLADVSQSDKRQFLVELLNHESRLVRSQAAEELQSQGMLESVVLEQLLQLLESDDAKAREAAIVALSRMYMGAAKLPDAFWEEVIQSLASDDPIVRDAAAQHVLMAGAAAVPLLLEHLKDERANVRRQAAVLLSQIVNPQPRAAAPASAAPEPTYSLAPPDSRVAPAKAPPEASQPQVAREIDAGQPTLVRVYFGTNREVMSEERRSWNTLKWLIPAFSVVLLLWGGFAWRAFGKDSQRGCLTWIVVGVGGLALVFLGVMLRDELVQMQSVGIGPKFGPRRERNAVVHYGYCDVSIPPSHTVGELEAPLLGPEDEDKHVILKRVEEKEEQQFFDLVKSEIAKRSPADRSCFVFIHGFNVRFDNAARRTAQIYHDLKFSGVPIFFSWPSRGSMHHYFSDRNEIGFSQYVIKDFLIDVAKRVDADRIHVIAHSMGADATCRAIADMGESGKVFDQIILAAPDIDREVFRLQLLPRMTASANRMTLYCSKNDLALHISNTFNDAPRAGDSSRGLLVAREIDTIDASGIDTALLGHSYYGDCLPILNDVRQLILEHLGPDQRKLKAWPFEEQLKYWTFAEEPPTAPTPDAL